MTDDTQQATRPPAREHSVDDDEMITFLEPDQTVIDKSQPIPRAQLSRRANAGLWALRVFVLVVTAMVLYTFFSQLGS